MRPKFKLSITVLVAAVALACSARIGFRYGRERPHIYWRTTDAAKAFGAAAFGWDDRNRCVAAWWYGTNGVPQGWERLER